MPLALARVLFYMHCWGGLSHAKNSAAAPFVVLTRYHIGEQASINKCTSVFKVSVHTANYFFGLHL
jgi:hypothetical protein